MYRFPIAKDQISDLRAAADNYIFPGYVPATPFIDPHRTIVAVGSCFAEHIANTLAGKGARTRLIKIHEAGNTPLATERLVTGLIFNDAKDPHIAAQVAGFNQAAVRADIAAASMIILTVGVALQLFRDGLPVFAYKRGDTLHMLSIEQICAAIRAIIDAARILNPPLHVVLTVSPVPLKTSDHPSVIGQDCLSKSLLRVAVDHTLQSGVANVSYWPSFEIIRWLGGHVGPFFGPPAEDNRHVHTDVLDLIMQLFIEKYFLSNPA